MNDADIDALLDAADSVQYEEIDDNEIDAVIRASGASAGAGSDAGSDSSDMSTGADVGGAKE